MMRILKIVGKIKSRHLSAGKKFGREWVKSCSIICKGVSEVVSGATTVSASANPNQQIAESANWNVE